MKPEGGRERGGLIAHMTAFKTDVPGVKEGHAFDIILVRPTRDSMGVSVVAYADEEGSISFWPRGHEGEGVMVTPVQPLPAGRPVLFTLSGLTPDAAYEYRLNLRARQEAKDGDETPSPALAASETFSFHTPRSPRPPSRPRPTSTPVNEGGADAEQGDIGSTGDSSFTFTIIADSHLDGPMTPAVYEQTLANALADKPDFHIDLGDTFMTDKRGREYKAALPQYVAQRYYFGTLCHSAPLFMVLGNHDGEWGYAKGRDGDMDAMAPWSFAQRTKYFPPPEIPTERQDNADGTAMYSGRTKTAEDQGANYYEFTWGDAQFIVLDPFWFTNEKARGPGGRGGGGGGGRGGGEGGRPADDADTALTDQGWTMTLGQPQYDWLVRTLDSSRSTFKFVFIHHLVGGFGRASRGGAAAAGYFEWGGKSADGSGGFAEHRPGWSLPIHQVLVKHHVSAVFHGHDHLYVHEELDGVTHQCVPQPGNVNGGTRSAAEYGYRGGTVLGSPGHVRVSVSPTSSTVEFVRAALGDAPATKPSKSASRTVAHSYEIPAQPKTPR